MRQEAHLQTFALTLKAKSPVFIGCGKSYTKKEYIFNPVNEKVSFLDENALFAYLAKYRLADAYEGYMLRGRGKDLRDFLQNTCRISQAQINKWIRCTVYAGDALDERHSLKEIQRFVRDSQGRVYVPGSSIKGALRTVLLKDELLHRPPQNPDKGVPFDKKKIDAFENPYFNTLTLKKDRDQMPEINNPLNSIMQGIRISDSLPVADDRMCLASKLDVFPDGGQNTINICRECISPGTEIHCTMTLDQSILREQITMEDIVRAIAEVSEYHQATVNRHYPQAPNDMNSKTILLGGGVGFQSKTVTDPYYGEEALDVTAKIMRDKFDRHHHEKDKRDGISPRALKQTIYKGGAYSYGVCEVSIQ